MDISDDEEAYYSDIERSSGGAGADAGNEDESRSSYEYADDADEMRYERDAFERIAPYVDRATTTTTTETTDIIRDPTHRFVVYVKGIANSMIGDRVLTFVGGELTSLVDYIRFVEDARYKNPVAFVVAYGATRASRGRDIDVVEINRLLPYVATMHPTSNVRLTDVVRYGRLWKDVFRRARRERS